MGSTGWTLLTANNFETRDWFLVADKQFRKRVAIALNYPIAVSFDDL